MGQSRELIRATASNADLEELVGARRPRTRPSATVVLVAGAMVLGLAIRVGMMLRSIAIIDRLYIPDDTYYTLTIARSIAHGHGPTADGTTLTSGFQPLLGFVMTPVFWFTNSPDAALRVDLAFLVIVDTATIAVLAWVAYRLAGQVAAVVAAGLWAISPAAVHMALGGLETSLAIFCEISLIAVWMWANDRSSPRRWAAVGVVAGVAVLARTDAAYLVALLVLVQVLRGPRRPLVPAAVVGAAVLAPWWIWCTAMFGTPLSTSGLAEHRLGQSNSFSHLSTSLALGAVGGGPFQTWDWLRARLLAKPGAGTAAFWVVVVALFAIAAWLVSRPPHWVGGRDPEASAGARMWPIAATLPAFAAGLLAFYAWYGVVIYDTRYLAPVALVCALFFGILAARVAATRASWKPLALAGVGVVLLAGILGAARTHIHDATVSHVAAKKPGAPASYDTPTGYREAARQVSRVIRPGSLVGARQSGALGYFNPGHHVVNLDGVVNPDAYAANTGIWKYIRHRRIEYLVDHPWFVANYELLLGYFPEQKPEAYTRVTSFPSVEGSSAIDVVLLTWPRP